MKSFLRKYAHIMMLFSCGLFLADSVLHYWGCFCPELTALEEQKGKDSEDKDEQKEEKDEKDEKEKNRFGQLCLSHAKRNIKAYASNNSFLSQVPSELETPPPELG